MMEVTFSERFTKYHGDRVKTAVINVPSKGQIELALSDTQRCARSVESAKRTLQNIADGALEDQEVETAGVALHAHCRRVIGLQDEAQP